jgi:uncharacterized protein YjbI with pentapeptide repeats
MTAEVKGSVPSEKNTGTFVSWHTLVERPKREEKRKWTKALAKFFKVWATPLTVLIAIAGLLWGVYQFNAQQRTDSQTAVRQQNLALTQEASAQKQARDQQEQTTLDAYIDRMTDLLLTYHLASKPANDVRVIARVRTLIALKTVDFSRRGIIIQFLWKAQLINGPDPIISLNTAYLAFANINSSYLYGINLSGALLSYADLNNCDLHNAILTGAQLDHADLRNTNLDNANLKGANLYATLFNRNSTLTGAIMPNGSIHP